MTQLEIGYPSGSFEKVFQDCSRFGQQTHGYLSNCCSFVVFEKETYQQIKKDRSYDSFFKSWLDFVIEKNEKVYAILPTWVYYSLQTQCSLVLLKFEDNFDKTKERRKLSLKYLPFIDYLAYIGEIQECDEENPEGDFYVRMSGNDVNFKEEGIYFFETVPDCVLTSAKFWFGLAN